MSIQQVCIAKADATRAIAYLNDRLEGSLIGQAFSQSIWNSLGGDFFTITSTPPPEGQNFLAGWGGQPTLATRWVVDEIAKYLHSKEGTLVLFDDTVSLPADPVLASKQHPPYWSYQNRVLWPVLPPNATPEKIEQIMAWAASDREIMVFTTLPSGMVAVAEPANLSQDVFQHVLQSISRLITDAYDGEGYLEWRRND